MDKNLTEMSKENLIDTIDLLEQKIDELSRKVDFYEEQIRLANKLKYGRRSEKTAEGQMSLMSEMFNEAEAFYDHEQETETKPSKKHGSNRKHLTKATVDVINTVVHPLESKVCDKCGRQLKVVGTEEVSTELVYHPGHYEMIIHKQEVGVCEYCNEMKDGKYDDSGFVRAPMPPRILPKSAASPSLLAKIVNDKYSKSIPLYRQEKEYMERGLDLTRQTMSNWIVRLNTLYLERIVEHMRRRMISGDLVLIDETPAETLHHPDKGASRNNSYMWVARTGPYEKIPVVIYKYETGRSYQFAKEMLEGYEGMVQSDAYQAYEDLPNIHLGCWAHMRRKLCESLDAMPKGTKKEDTSAYKLKGLIDRMFALEKKIKGKSIEERKIFRQEKILPVMDEYFSRMHSINDLLEVGHTTEQFKKAVRYAINQEEILRNVLKYGEADLSDNAVERVIRNFTIGRKNFMFFNTTSGGEASGSIYSIIVTAKENGLKSYSYLEYLFTKLPLTDLNDEDEIEKLMPWYEGLPKELRLTK